MRGVYGSYKQTKQWRALERFAERSDAIECDCGRPKLKRSDEACQYCAFLDGKSATLARLIAVLRTGVEMTAMDLAMELGVSVNAIHQRVSTVLSTGRVVRQLRQADGVEGEIYGKHGTRRAILGSRGRYVYMLSARRAA